MSRYFDTPPDIDLGHDHKLWFYGWAPDRELNPQYADRPDIDKLGATIGHLRPDGEECCCGVMFDIPGAEHFPGARWQVQSWEPLTISPSLLCKAIVSGEAGDPEKGIPDTRVYCDDHGFIRDGKWVPA